MRIIFFALKLDLQEGGGANRGMDIKLRGLHKLGHEVRLVTIFPELNRLPPEGVPYPVDEASCTDRAFLSLQDHVLRTLRSYEEHADLFHIDGTSFLWAGGMYRAEGGRIPTVAYLPTYAEVVDKIKPEAPDPKRDLTGWFCFHVLIRIQRLKHWLWGKLVGLKYARQLDVVFVDSPVLGAAYEHFGFPKDRLEVLPEFVDEHRFRSFGVRRTDMATAYGPDRPLRLFYAGRLIRTKGPDLLIRAVANVRRSGRNVTVRIKGNGPQIERLQCLAKGLDVSDAVKFESWADERELAQGYAECDVFVHPCRHPEPFGRTVLEALFFDKPVITSKGSGSAWAVGDAGIATKMGSAVDLERAIRELYDDPSRISKLLAAAPERIRYFDHRVWIKRLSDRLERLIAPPKSGTA